MKLFNYSRLDYNFAVVSVEMIILQMASRRLPGMADCVVLDTLVDSEAKVEKETVQVLLWCW